MAEKFGEFACCPAELWKKSKTWAAKSIKPISGRAKLEQQTLVQINHGEHARTRGKENSESLLLFFFPVIPVIPVVDLALTIETWSTGYFT